MELAKVKRSGVELMFKLGGVTTFKKISNLEDSLVGRAFVFVGW